MICDCVIEGVTRAAGPRIYYTVSVACGGLKKGEPYMWTKRPLYWQDDRTLYASIVFSWHLPEARAKFEQGSFFWDSVVVGGPAVRMNPGYFSSLPHVSEGDDIPGMLQRHNPEATRTSLGCVRKCKFCGVKKIEPEFRELAEWPIARIVCDNNLLACSDAHFERVIDSLLLISGVDFN